jgi:hypothetical protein
MTIGRGVTLTRTPNEKEPGYMIDTFSKAQQQEFLAGYNKQYPRPSYTIGAMDDTKVEQFRAPGGYSDHEDHHRNFITSVRTRKPVVEDAAFGYRAAAPAMASNVGYFEKRLVNWDPIQMKEA